MNPIASLALLLCVLSSARASNILMMSAWGASSHLGFYGQIASILADRGHKITVISPHNVPAHQNVTHIKTDTNMFKFINNTFDLQDMNKMQNLAPVFDKACIDAVDTPQIRNLDISKFDLVMNALHFSECFLPIIRTAKVPHVLFLPTDLSSLAHVVMGSVQFPSVSVTVSGLTTYTYPMTFKERGINTLLECLGVFHYRYLGYSGLIKMCKERGLCAEEMPPTFEQVSSKASLLFVNSVASLQNPARPLPPNIINVGGLNCRPAKQLPEDLNSWAESSGENGFIYFSLGTAVKVSDMNPETVKAFLNVFGRLKQKVIWKTDIDLGQDFNKYISSNVKHARWLPQQDLIGHTKCRLFITHGGMFSSMEATYHGIPLLTTPVFFDQHYNSAKAQKEQWAKKLDWDLLNETSIEDNLKVVLNDPKYAIVAKKRSTIMKDQPISNRDLVVYWTEYVMRHNGAPFLRTPFYDMPWYQIYNLDVWATILLVVFVVLYVAFRLCKLVLGTCWRKVMKRKVKQQ